MLLSRVANSIYWIGRYIERAENVNRHVLVSSEFAVELEGIFEEIAVREWESLVSSLPRTGTEAAIHGQSEIQPESILRYMVSFLVDRENPYAVVTSLGKARENARTVAESITVEVTTNLNEAHRRLSSHRTNSIKDLGVAQDIGWRTHNSILTTLGAIEHTLTRDEGWNYMKLGEAIERTQRSVLVLRTRLPNLLRWQENTEDPLYYASWRSVLRTLASLENYRQENGPRFTPDQVVRFLLFHPTTPRSVYCGVRRMIGYLNGMADSGAAAKDARRRLGRLAARLEYEQDDIMAGESTLTFMDDVLAELYHVHEAVSNPTKRR